MKSSDVDLQTAYAVVHTLHTGTHCAPDDSELMVASENSMRAWFQQTIADNLYERQLLLDEAVVLTSVYIAELLTSRRGQRYRSMRYEDPPLALRLQRLVEESRGAPHFLALAEQAFFMFCFFPELRARRPVEYRRYALAFGRAAYGTHAVLTDIPLGKHMESAFEPLGEIVRQKFTPHG